MSCHATPRRAQCLHRFVNIRLPQWQQFEQLLAKFYKAGVSVDGWSSFLVSITTLQPEDVSEWIARDYVLNKFIGIWSHLFTRKIGNVKFYRKPIFFAIGKQPLYWHSHWNNQWEVVFDCLIDRSMWPPGYTPSLPLVWMPRIWWDRESLWPFEVRLLAWRQYRR